MIRGYSPHTLQNTVPHGHTRIVTAKGDAMIGIIKEFDKLGRIVIPKELRDRYGLHGKVEVVATKDGILLQSPRYVLTEREGTKE